MDIRETFKKYEDDFLKFEEIAAPVSKRSDLCAFLILERLLPGEEDIIGASEHDEFFLSIDVEKLAEVATELEIRDLVRCGIRYDSQYDCLAMFS